MSAIKQQLDYREENKKNVSVFQTTRTLGTNKKVLIDEEAGKFTVMPASDLLKDNPDVFAYSDLIDCILNIEEIKREILRDDKKGKGDCYSPARYEHMQYRKMGQEICATLLQSHQETCDSFER